MSAKKLDQSVFDGLPSEYRWAIVDSNQSCWVSTKRPERTDEYQWIFGNVSAATIKAVGGAFDATHWKNSLIERQDMPTSDIDWSKAPEGATHYNTSSGAFFRCLDSDGSQLQREMLGAWVSLDGYTIADLESSTHTIKRPESITDVARSIEAARVAEKSMPYPDGDERYFETSDVPETKKYPHYFKDVSGVDAIDLYHVARLYQITDPALFHAFKKIACAGKRGAKDQAQDVQEAIDALKRWKELNV